MSENAYSNAKKQIFLALKFAAALLVVALLLTVARSQGLIDQDQVVRAYNVAMGLGFAAYFNFMPKLQYRPQRSLSDATLAQAALRFNAWAMTLAFLAWAAIWAFVPREHAVVASVAVLVAALAVNVGYVVWKVANRGTSKSA